MRKITKFLAAATLTYGAALLISPPLAGAHPATPTSVQNIRYWNTGEYTRIIIDLDSDAQYQNARISNPDRIYFDISHARLSSDFLNRSVAVGDGYLRQVRAAENREDVVRVVLEVSAVGNYRVSELHNPFRIVVDLHGQHGARIRADPLPQAFTPRPDEVGTKAESVMPVADGPAVPGAPGPSTLPGVAGTDSAPSASELKPAGKPSGPTGDDSVQPLTAATTSVQDIRYRAISDSTRVVIELDSHARYENARISDPDRIYFDISNAKLSEDFPNQLTIAGDDLLRQVRAAENRVNVVRVVLNISSVRDYSVSELHNPFRIVIDLRGEPGARNKLISSSQASHLRPDEMGSVTGSALRSAVTQAAQTPPEPPTAPDGNIVATTSPRAASDQQQPSLPPVRTSVSNEADLSPSLPSDVVAIQSPGSIVASGSARLRGKPKAGPRASSTGGQPLTVKGTVSSGFYNSYTRGGGNSNQRLRFVPASAKFDIDGYYMTPDLLDYSVQPELDVGPQASDAGFEGGNGIRLRLAALRRVLPLTLRYSNVQLEDVYFGSLSQVSSYTRKNRNREFGLTAALKHHGLPTTTIDWGTTSDNSLSNIAVIPDYSSHATHLNVDTTYQRSGWDFRGYAGRMQQTADLFSPVGEDSNSSVLRQKVLQYQGSARRSFLKDSELYVDGGSQTTANLLSSQTIDLTTHYANLNLRIFQRKRWKSSLRAGYTSNISGLLLTQWLGGLGSNGSIAPESSVLLPFQRTISYLNLNGLTSIDLSHGFGLYGSVDRTSVLTPTDNALSSRYLTTAGGVTYARTFGWGSLSGQYGHSYGMGSVTGQTGRIEGRNYVFNVQPGKWDRLQLDISLHGTDQWIRNELPANDHSLASEGNIGLRLFGQVRTRLGGGWQQSQFANGGADFHARGYTARLGIEHPRIQLDGSLNSNIGSSLQSFGQIYSGIGVESALLSPLHLVPSAFQGLTLTLHAMPTRRLELSAIWTRSKQHLEGVVANDFEIIDAYATYHFRKIEIRAGFFRSTQIYSSYLGIYPETERGRAYLRIMRSVKVL